uniref:Probable N-acetyltransferase 14 n=1 Tax=Geotrypetes seraphini TaxID=260995 RepID=A0A6P8SL29_GEOSA|nr:N-acetyltransferase 14 [Geotrypetes seraphini]XP_033815900.1 N-acetyltransferase 14 [Geotrypetes seraphini]XP_033815901.1 N-acetyltransferase 14 [Geotrypetes seraphini]
MPLLDESQLSVREIREDEQQIVLEILKEGFKDMENRLILYILTRPPTLLLLAVVSSGLRFLLHSFLVALLLPVLFAVAALKLVLWRSPDLHHIGSGSQQNLWVAVYSREDVCGCVALEPTAEPTVVELRRLAVSRWYRRSGVGTALLHFIEEKAQREGFTAVVIHISVMATAAVALLEKSGYITSGGRDWLGYTVVQKFRKVL